MSHVSEAGAFESVASGPAGPLPLAIGVVLGGALLTAVYGYAPPFVVNQHAYFLHGLANAGVGHLAHDTLAQTADGWPVFSLLVEFIYRTAGDGLVLAVHVLLNGTYIVGVCAIAIHLYPRLARPELLMLFVAVLLGVHSALLHRSGFGPLVFDRNWLLGGVAGHTLLSPYLVQQTFGSLLVLSIATFLHGRPYLAGLLIAVASTVHPVYLFPGAGLTLAYMLVMLRRGEGLWRASLLGATTLILVLPVTGLVFSAFGPTTPESYARAHEILATVRSPHHALLERWLWSDRTLLQADPAVKLGLVLAGIFLSRHTAMAPILAAPLLLTLAAIAYVAVSGDYSVAHAYPWRSFALLVPVATASIIASLIARLGRRIRGERPLSVIAGVALLGVGFLAIGGIRISAETFARRKAAPWAAVADFVRETATEEDLYLIPPLWKPLWDFRINSGARVFVDWKSPAIKDVEVLEWFERLQAASAVYGPRRTQLTNCEALGRLVRDYPVTHIVTAMPSPGCPGLRQAYYDGRFAIYRRIAPR